MLSPEMTADVAFKIPVLFPLIGASIVAFAKANTVIKEIRTGQTGRVIKHPVPLETDTLYIIYMGDGATADISVEQNGQPVALHVEDLNPRMGHTPTLMMQVDGNAPQYINVQKTNKVIPVQGMTANALLLENGNSQGMLAEVKASYNAQEMSGF